VSSSSRVDVNQETMLLNAFVNVLPTVCKEIARR
jgi:hypothetical protein